MGIKEGRCICGTVTVGERGQIVIPKKARDYFDFKPNEELIVLADSEIGITIVKPKDINDLIEKLKFYEVEYAKDKEEK
ncbi:AbrB family looped-hinge helix DNA binding protein [Bacilli bacterium PM5-3]|nr:AbrB family looped-hinge helix DNA binding protein [Bacilli bacterium PM5-3]MDH6603198.1 AbrB family looped-hinge helix DNA binding protein [Bacilli bacterium PM5-9]